jgi:PAS domain S-box-containing protein
LWTASPEESRKYSRILAAPHESTAVIIVIYATYGQDLLQTTHFNAKTPINLERFMFKFAAASCLFCLAAAIIFHFFLAKRQARRDLLQKMEYVADAQALSLARRLWDLDYDRLTTQAQNMLLVKGVGGVLVQEVSGAFELRLGDFSWGKDEVAEIICVKKLHSPDGPFDIIIGELQVIGDPRFLQKTLWRHVAASGGVLAVFGLGMLLFIMLGFRKSVTATLAGLSADQGALSKPGDAFAALEACLLRLRRQATEDAGRIAGLECALPGGTFVARRLDNVWKLDFLGEGAARLLEADSAQIPENLMDIFHKDCREPVRRLLQSAVDNPEARCFSLEPPRGENAGWRLHAVISRDADNLAVYGVVLDEKRRLSAEVRAANLQEEMKVLMAARTSMVRIDRDERVLAMTAEFSEMFGYASQDLDGLHFKDLHLSQASYSVFARDYLDAVEQRGLDVSYRLKRKNGQPVWSRILARPSREAPGPGLWLVVQDISKQKQLQQELQIHSTDLHQAVEQCRQAEEDRNDFLENMSHELRTPLNAIMGITELLLRSNPTTEQHERLMDLHESSQTLHGVVNDILDYPRLDDANVTLQTEVFSLPQLLDCLSKTHQGRAAAKGVAFSISASPESPNLLLGDNYWLFQILSRIVSHTVRRAQDGCVHLRVEMLERSSNEVLLRFSVWKEGVGPSVQRFGALCESVSSKETIHSGRTEGFGFETGICRRMAEQMGGEIRVESSVDKGGVFYFSLKFREAGLLAHPLQGSPGRRGWTKDRVLVVEDNCVNRRVIREILEMADLKVQEAEGGESALEMLELECYDAVLMDVQMPTMDGLETVRRIRKNPATSDLPVIAMTAHALVRDRERCIEAGMSDYLSKPVEVDQLLKVLSRWLGAQTSEHNALSAPDQESEETKKLPPGFGRRVDMHDQLVTEFLRQYSDAPQTIRDALHVGDVDKALRCARRLEGLSGNLGAKPLQQAAARLTQDFYLGTETLEKRLKALQSALDQLMSESKPRA